MSVLPSTPRSLAVRWLGTVPYPAAWELQKRLAATRAAGEGEDTLLLLEHPPVYTLGRNSHEEHILVPRDRLRGAIVEQIDRGGEVTFHGPGQLVGYPVILLREEERSISGLVERLEEVIIRTLDHYDIVGRRLEDQRGVWANGRKIASVGLSVKRWVVTHGMALNVAPDLSYFTLINPCGHPETVMTSMAEVKGEAPPIEEVGAVFAGHFARLFDRRRVPGDVCIAG